LRARGAPQSARTLTTPPEMHSRKCVSWLLLLRVCLRGNRRVCALRQQLALDHFGLAHRHSEDRSVQAAVRIAILNRQRVERATKQAEKSPRSVWPELGQRSKRSSKHALAVVARHHILHRTRCQIRVDLGMDEMQIPVFDRQLSFCVVFHAYETHELYHFGRPGRLLRLNGGNQRARQEETNRKHDSCNPRSHPGFLSILTLKKVRPTSGRHPRSIAPQSQLTKNLDLNRKRRPASGLREVRRRAGVISGGRARRFPTRARILRSSSPRRGPYPSSAARSPRATVAAQFVRSCRPAHTL